MEEHPHDLTRVSKKTRLWPMRRATAWVSRKLRFSAADPAVKKFTF
jgi:hypothetical protein